MKRLSEINEGFWKPGINRAKLNTVREEDKINSNVYELKPVDLGLPFLVANRSLTINDKVDICFSDFEMSDERKKIEKLGWRLPTPDEMDRILSSNISGTTIQGLDFFSLKKRGNQVTIGPHHGLDNLRLWCPEHNSPVDPYSKIFILDYHKSSKTIYRIESSQQKYHRAEILLVRDKKEVNEALWKPGINRAKSNTIREEDKINSNIYNLNGVDLGLPFLVADDVLKIDGNPIFDGNRLKEYMDFINSQGWRIMDVKDAGKFCYNLTFNHNPQGDDMLVISNDKNKNVVKYDVSNYGTVVFYWVIPYGEIRTIKVNLGLSAFSDHCNADTSKGRMFDEYEVILIKDKK